MLKDLFSLVTIVALLFSSCSKSDEEENSDEPQPTKQTAYFGVNLSGAEFGNVYPGVDGTHYGYPTEKDLDYFKAKGLYLVRFPFRWERREAGCIACDSAFKAYGCESDCALWRSH